MISGKKMQLPLYVVYTPSHKILFDEWFFPSLKKNDNGNIRLVITELPQECESAKYKEEGWTDTTKKKVDYIIQAIEENWGRLFIYSDVDTQFFEPFFDLVIKLIKSKDFLVQKNSPSGTLCSGFFICRANEKTLALWRSVRAYMETSSKISDQEALNHYLNKKSNFFKVRWDYLPDSFFGGGLYTGKRWNPDTYLSLPEIIIFHHANYTSGIKNKIKQLNHVADQVRERKNQKQTVDSNSGKLYRYYGKYHYPFNKNLYNNVIAEY